MTKANQPVCHSLPASDGKRGRWQLENNSTERLKVENQGQLTWSNRERGWGGVPCSTVTVRSLKVIVKAVGNHQSFEHGIWHDPTYILKKPICSLYRKSASVLWQSGTQSLLRRNKAGEREQVGRMGQWGWEKVDREGSCSLTWSSPGPLGSGEPLHRGERHLSSGYF